MLQLLSTHESVVYKRRQHERVAMLIKILSLARFNVPSELKDQLAHLHGGAFEDAHPTRLDRKIQQIERSVSAALKPRGLLLPPGGR